MQLSEEKILSKNTYLNFMPIIKAVDTFAVEDLSKPYVGAIEI